MSGVVAVLNHRSDSLVPVFVGCAIVGTALLVPTEASHCEITDLLEAGTLSSWHLKEEIHTQKIKNQIRREGSERGRHLADSAHGL